MSYTHISMTGELSAYLRSVSLREPDVLKRLRDETAAQPQARMQITPEQGQLMRLLVKITGTKLALEVGVFTGYSALSVALALPSDGRLVACDVSEEWTSIARRYWAEAGVAGRIDLRLAPAMETLDGLLREGGAGQFDMAFVDADKPNYLPYVDRIFQLLRPGGLLLVDNVLWHGRVIDTTCRDADTEAIRELNRRLHADERFDISMLPLGDGLTIAMKR